MRSVDASADLVPPMESPPGSMRMPSMSKGTSCRRAEISTPAITYDPDRHTKPQPTVAPRHEGAPGLVALGVARSAGGVVADSDRRITFEEVREPLFRNYASKKNRTDPVPRVGSSGNRVGGSGASPALSGRRLISGAPRNDASRGERDDFA